MGQTFQILGAEIARNANEHIVLGYDYGQMKLSVDYSRCFLCLVILCRGNSLGKFTASETKWYVSLDLCGMHCFLVASVSAVALSPSLFDFLCMLPMLVQSSLLDICFHFSSLTFDISRDAVRETRRQGASNKPIAS